MTHSTRPHLLAILFALIFSFSRAQTIQPYFFGVNAWMPDTVGNASNCQDPPCIKNGKLHKNWQKVKESKTQIVRFGGIAPDKNMPTNFQYIRMIDSIRANGMEPIVQVPYWNGRYTGQQAAAIVQYVNVTRSKNIKYWIIGNEPDLKYAATSASQVAAYIKPFATAMKAVDSTIKIIGPETAWFNKGIIDGLTNPGGSSDITGKDANGRYYVDIVSFHTYPMGDNSASLPSRGQLIAKLTGTNSFESNLTYLNSRLTTANSYHSRSGTKALRAAVTEANVVYSNSSGDDIYGVGANSFIGGQFVAEIYGIGLSQGLAFINLWSVIEGSGALTNLGFLDPTTGNRKPLFYHFKMMAENFKGSSIVCTDNQTNVKVFGSKNGMTTTVLIMNQELTTNHRYTIRLNTAAPSGTNALKINVNSGVASEYSDTIGNQSSVVLQFDGGGNLTRKCVYSLSVHAVANIPPTCTDYTITDLAIAGSSVSPASALAGGTVQLKASLTNHGSSTATLSTVGFYLSADTLVNNGDVLLASAPGTTLGSGAAALRQATASIPSNKASGNYYILAKADHNGSLNEINENNNVRSLPFSVLQAAHVDLVIHNAAASPTNVMAGGVLTLTSTIFNAGTTTAYGGKIGYYISSDTVLDNADGFMAYSSPATLTAANGALKTKTVSIPFSKPSGTHYILLVADYAGEVAEVNEQNNMQRVKINVSQPASVDLVINSGTLSAGGLYPSSSFSVSALIANTGTTSAQVSKVGFYLSADTVFGNGDSFAGFAGGAQLNAGSTALRQSTVTLPNNAAAGVQYLLMVADHNAEVAETNETNNVRSFSFTVLPVPSVDLRISSASATPTNLLAGGTLTLTSTVMNSGSTTATSGRTGYYLSSDSLFDNSDVFMSLSGTTTLTAGASAVKTQTVFIQANQAAGAYYILFVADHAAECSETNELNNVSRVKVQVNAAPQLSDLVIKNPSLSASTVVAGNKFNVSSMVYNSGNMAAASSKVGYYLSTDTLFQSSDVLLGYSQGYALSAGTGSQKNFTLKSPVHQKAGQYFILFYADHTASVAESNEQNNIRAVAITIQSRHQDISLATINGGVLSGLAGNEIQSTILVRNTGNVVLDARLRYYLSSDSIYDFSDVLLAEEQLGLLADGSKASHSSNLQIPQSAVKGDYYLLARAEGFDEVTQADEQSNVISLPVSVTDISTGIQEANALKFLIYPNPSRGMITIEGAELQQEITLEVLDISGMVVHTRQASSFGRKQEIELPASLMTGVYFVRLTSGKTVTTKSIILSR